MNGLTKRQINSGLKTSVKEGAAHAGMLGLVDSYITPFALALGSNNSQIGLLTSIPKLISAIMQPFIGHLIEQFGSRKRMATISKLIISLLWLPAATLLLMPQSQAFFLFLLILIIYSAAVSTLNTAWASWMADLVPEKVRGSYFGRRDMVAGAAGLLTTLLGGWILGITETVSGFATVFVIGTFLGLVSIGFLRAVPEPEYKIIHFGHNFSFNINKFIRKMQSNKQFFIFTKYRMLLNFSIWLASPFFTVYMLKTLNISYFLYSIILGVEAIVWIFSEPYWGKLSDRWGDRTVLVIANMFVLIYPFTWLFITSASQLPLILLASIASGFAFSGLELASFNFLLDSTPTNHRPIYISNYKLFAIFALFAGPFIGGFLAEALSDRVLFGLVGLQILFLLSFLMRLVSLSYATKLKELRVSERSPSIPSAVFKAVAVYPAIGIMRDVAYAHHCMSCWTKRIREKGIFR